MIFVNRIADFVHRAVVDNDGAPNKNVGDAFQLAWRMPERRILGQQVCGRRMRREEEEEGSLLRDYRRVRGGPSATALYAQTACK